MARIRSVSPDLCVSEKMAGLSAELERTFVRLWTHCDDHGRCLDNPRLIKAGIFPLLDEMTPDVLDEHLDALAAEGLITRYEADGQRLIAVCSWSEYQHPQKPRPSKYAAPPVAVRDTDGTCTGSVANSDGPGGEKEGEGYGEGDSTPHPPAQRGAKRRNGLRAVGANPRAVAEREAQADRDRAAAEARRRTEQLRAADEAAAAAARPPPPEVLARVRGRPVETVEASL